MSELAGAGLRVLVVDDEQPVRDELAYLLAADPRIDAVDTAASGADALRLIGSVVVDVIFLDIAMPGLDGMEVARLLAQLAVPPRIVFVTAHDQHAVDAFDLHAVDYLLKPVRPERLIEAVRRVVGERDEAGPAPLVVPDDTVIAVERGGVTRFVARSEVVWVEAHGDYARLHTGSDAYLVRVPLTTLEDQWAPAGFVRIHRSLLVDIRRVLEVRSDAGRVSVVVPAPGPGGRVELQVARRHARQLRDRLLRGTRP
ncbi:MAG: LytTR family DNA-binding domain-containing protein [Actinomycetota bacterium]|nr:LytTR family DNA-binding domain-containing protein [Actinomycetota bacterium]